MQDSSEDLLRVFRIHALLRLAKTLHLKSTRMFALGNRIPVFFQEQIEMKKIEVQIRRPKHQTAETNGVLTLLASSLEICHQEEPRT